MAEITQTQKEYIQKNFYPSNFREPGVLDEFANTCYEDIKVFNKALNDVLYIVKPLDDVITKDKMLFQKFMYDKYYKIHWKQLISFEDECYSPEVPYFDEEFFGIPYFIPIEYFGDNLEVSPKEIIKNKEKYPRVKKFGGTYPMFFGSRVELFIALFNKDEKVLEELINLFSELKSDGFVVLYAYLVKKLLAQKLQKELDRKDDDSKVVKV